MPTATIAAPTTSLVSTAYAELAAELRALAARITSDGAALVGPMSPAAVLTAARPCPGFRAYAQRAAVIALDLVFTFIVLPVLAFNVAMWLFPPVR
jgi:hypothetical protein